MTSSISAIHVAKKQLGLDDDTYRAKLARITGKSSAKDMTEAEREKVLQVFRNEGFKPAPAAHRPDGRRKLTGKYAKKMQALWIAGWNLGVVRNKDDDALRAFIVGRATPIEAAEWLHYADDAERCIEPLKIMLARDGGVSWKGRMPDGQRIALAQWAILGHPQEPFWMMVEDILKVGGLPDPVSDRDWIKVMNHLGALVRKRKAGAQ